MRGHVTYLVLYNLCAIILFHLNLLFFAIMLTCFDALPRMQTH